MLRTLCRNSPASRCSSKPLWMNPPPHKTAATILRPTLPLRLLLHRMQKALQAVKFLIPYPPPEGVAEQKPAASEDSQPADAAANSEQPAVCTCTEPCSEESQNAECPVCSSDPALCKAKGEQSEPEADADPPKPQQDSTEASKAKPTLLEAEDEGLLAAAEEVENPAAKIGENAYATLAEAIEAAQNGDTIILQRDLPESVTIESKQNLTLNLNGCTLSGAAENGPVIAVNGSNNLTVTGGTIAYGTDGGIRIKNDYNTVVRLVDVTVSDNYTANCGGGIYLEGPEAEPTESEQFPVLVLTGSTTISTNTADLDGGGIYAKHARVNLNGGTVESNRSSRDGGGVYVENGFLQLFQATVKKNQGSENGGGIAVKNCGFDIVTSEIYENEVKNGGGVYATENSALRMGSGSISGNTATSSGGIYADSTSTSQLTGGDVYNNHAGTAGDDLYLLGTATGTTLLRAVGTDWVLSDCGHNIDGWYLDGKDARWNADAANAETYYVTNLEKQVDGTAIVKNADGSYTLTGAISLKAAHGLYGYTVRYLEKDTNKELHESKRVENQPLGTEVTESAVDISGYDQVAPTQVSITLSADSEKNVITFYYTLHRSSGGHTSTPEPEQKPDPTPTPTPVPPVVVPSTPAPTTPVRRIAPAAQPTPAPTAAPTAQPADSQPAKAESEPEVIEADETPLAPMGGGAWALVNLILMLLTVLASLLLLLGYLGKKKYAKEDEYGNALHDANGNEIIDYTRNKKGFWRVASLIPAVAAVIAFVLTENMRLPMIMVDRWTLLMVIIAVVQLIVAVLCKKKKEYEEDEDEANI